ncbi:response regulator transcription factor [Bifidobacterium sp. ESL0690]|uniref:response regulator transcription factor n=1 Tax=Bifidobacterium sp. ESL0690 TaxID=2983214 RepID=UPI0023FA3856|nr:response regulator transcription factor [Bifidobacterium sp. ESL0690]WEV46127.1 response regulator transcription factor [Bifidobacterium sp. ESL0690]
MNARTDDSAHARILVVDDEPAITAMLSAMLSKEGYYPTTINDSRKVKNLDLEHFDVMLIDVMMPHLNGFDLVGQIRDRVDCPILFLTAKTSEQDAVDGYGLGADDYIRKPFGKAELMAKIAAHIRRYQHQHHRALIVGPYRFDFITEALTYAGDSVSLTGAEYRICEYLARHRSMVVSRRTLEEILYEETDHSDSYPYNGGAQVIAVHISNIRTKFKRWGVDPIRTVRSSGYQWIGC